MNYLFCLPHPCGFSACVFLCRSGGFRLRSRLDPPAPGAPATFPSVPTAGEGVPRAAAAPGGPSSRPGRTRPGSRPAPSLAPGRGNWQAGAALPGGGEGGGVPRRQQREDCSNPPPGSGQTERAWARRSPDANPMGRALGWLRDQERGPPTADALDPGLGLSGPEQPPAWENPGPLPGAAALPGRAGEGIPGICPETAVASLYRIGPCRDSASAASAGKAPARAAGRGCARALRVSPQASCPPVMGGWTASPPWTFQPQRSGDKRRVGRPE